MFPNASEPTAVLLSPVVFAVNASLATVVLLPPVVFASYAFLPSAVLDEPNLVALTKDGKMKKTNLILKEAVLQLSD